MPIGLGASTILRLPAGHAQTAPRNAHWRVYHGRPATAHGHALAAEDRLRAQVIERLPCDFAIDPSAFEDRDAVHALTGPIASAWRGAFALDGGGSLQVRSGIKHLV
ncbi:hypothetical protein [uncultured Jannaschia sp.]|uniref:hypothetical protein n=1 Tax=uncultured Jannaschia sp. TaxID=293347 RepID=UPI0026331E4B|nr:hypothetical protein [uncultured Jannaschia sp.]